MDLFPNFGKRREEKQAIQAEQRQMKFSEEQNTVAGQAQDDQTYMYEQQQRTDLLIWQQDFKSDLDVLRYKFLGYLKDQETNKWVAPKKIQKARTDGSLVWELDPRPMCNELFYSQVVEPLCSFFLSRSFTNSHLSDYRINDLLKRTFNNLAKTLVIKHEDYDIRFKDFDDIDRELKSVLIPAAFRALEGWTKKTDSTMIKRLEAVHERPEAIQKKGFFGIGG